MQDGTGDPTQQDPQPDAYAQRSQSSHLWYEVRLCLGYLTRIPVFSVEYSGHSSLAQASWAFPVVGLFVGLVGAAALWLTDMFGLAAQLSALLALMVMTILTCALHESGLARTADSFGLTGEREQRLAALADPRLGVFGMVALIAIFTARWLTLGDLVAISFSDGVITLIAATAISRGVLPFIMHAVPDAQADGASLDTSRPEARPAGIALAISAILALFAFGFGGTIIMAVMVCLVAFIIVQMGKKLIGGQTGDVLGAVQQLTEVCVLVTAASFAS